MKLAAALVSSLALASFATPASAQVHVTWLWHLEQPIYWPAPDASGVRYQRVWESMQAKAGGAQHPENDLDEIFGKADRVDAYQGRLKGTIEALLGYPEAGAQVSYSGGLAENIASLGEHNALGYGSGWNSAIREAQGWSTSQGTPRLDVVIFPFHHALLPLLDTRVVRMELATYKAHYGSIWNAGRMSRGVFPSEMAFSERIIPALAAEGLDWVIVSNSHISRACADYPWVAGSGGDNIPPPNLADQLNPAQGSYNRISIDRGVSPANAYPYAYRPHRARYVDPATGQASSVVVVPAAQSESWRDGYSCYGLDDANEYASTSEAAHPILVVLAHDGDNAFGGGFTYYNDCVPGLAGTAAGRGWVPSTIAGYLADHPVAADDVVHVEDGAWVNADGDFGAPTFLNWNWPLMGASGVDIAAGWAEDERNFAVIVAATNWVLSAEDAVGPVSPAHVVDPHAGGGKLAQAWHFLLGGLNSGYMYYGKALDMELKPVVASNTAIARAKEALGSAADTTGPTVFPPQRYPDNPGALNFGPLYGYQQKVMPTDLWVWTFAYDRSGMGTVKLRYRVDADGRNDPATDVNEVYAGGAGVGAWVDVPMNKRVFPKGNPTNDPEIDTSILPDEIADEYWVKIEGLESVLVDYYVEATDGAGQVTRSAIQHVWIGDGAGAVGPSDDRVTPSAPCKDDVITVRGDKPGKLHWGVDGWTSPDASLWPVGTVSFDASSVETPLTACGDAYCVDLGPFGALAATLDFVFHYDDGSWDNNGGQDWHVALAQSCGSTGEDTSSGDPDAGSTDVVADTVGGGDSAGDGTGAADTTPEADDGTGGSKKSEGCSGSTPDPTALLGLALALVALHLRRRRAA
ncbi:MAG: hypothetical protein EP329_11310 [Deltaproteobacteria bacterium]|nr:MAG: hypothetical protein EP329_11310 [Deltaproteobacteria bacterium]